MEFLFVLPVPGSAVRDNDEVTHLEERVSEALGATAKVDLRRVGPGETDFLILTTNPLEVYDALSGFGDFDARPELRAAYRQIDTSDVEVYQREASFRFHIA
ncbi:MAG: hypothetical protein E6J13_09510 [Chloroflexi bacterium]|nr:MAG: hypothetical protein E6J13_09510 [Chloroflexota bacterium]